MKQKNESIFIHGPVQRGQGRNLTLKVFKGVTGKKDGVLINLMSPLLAFLILMHAWLDVCTVKTLNIVVGRGSFLSGGSQEK